MDDLIFVVSGYADY